jgi:hypothetical protein
LILWFFVVAGIDIKNRFKDVIDGQITSMPFLENPKKALKFNQLRKICDVKMFLAKTKGLQK